MAQGQRVGMGEVVDVEVRYEKNAVNVHRHPSISTIVSDTY